MSVRPRALELAHVVLDQHRGHRRAEERLPGRHGAHGRQQVLVGGVLEQVRARAGGERADDVGLVGVHAQDDHGGGRCELLRRAPRPRCRSSSACAMSTISVSGWCSSQRRSASRPSAASATTVSPASRLEQAAQAATDDAVVVSQQHAQAATSTGRAGSGSRIVSVVPAPGALLIVEDAAAARARAPRYPAGRDRCARCAGSKPTPSSATVTVEAIRRGG